MTCDNLLSDYERAREESMRENRKVLEMLGLLGGEEENENEHEKEGKRRKGRPPKTSKRDDDCTKLPRDETPPRRETRKRFISYESCFITIEDQERMDRKEERKRRKKEMGEKRKKRRERKSFFCGETSSSSWTEGEEGNFDSAEWKPSGRSSGIVAQCEVCKGEYVQKKDGTMRKHVCVPA